MDKKRIQLPYEGSFAERDRVKPQRVAICIPSGDMVHADFAMSLAALTAFPKNPIALLNRKGSLVATNRNVLVELAQELKMEWVLFLDSDMVFPRDTIERLLSHQQEIVGATYVKRVPPYELLGQTLECARLEEASGCHEVAGLPTGCLLIHMSVFDKVKKPWFRTPAVEADPANGVEAHIEGEDYYFCRVARDAGFSVWLDVDLTNQIGHIGQQVFRIPTIEEDVDAAVPKLEIVH